MAGAPAARQSQHEKVRAAEYRVAGERRELFGGAGAATVGIKQQAAVSRVVKDTVVGIVGGSGALAKKALAASGPAGSEYTLAPSRILSIPWTKSVMRSTSFAWLSTKVSAPAPPVKLS